MKRLARLLPFLVIFCAVSAKPAVAQVVGSTCNPPLHSPNSAPPLVSLLVATHKCLLANYDPDIPNYDYVQATVDLEQAGISHLVAGPDGLSTAQRVSILNDYAFWKLQQHDGWTTHQAANVLQLVVKLAPNRAVAWLNLGDALRQEMDSVSFFPNGVFMSGTLSPTPAQKKALASQALAAYRHYVVLSPKPVARVSTYLNALPSLQPAQAANWSTLDAILHTADEPKAAAVVLSLDDQPAAKLALAMDLALFLPNPNLEQINDLLQATAPDSWATLNGFDGTATSFVPYLQVVVPPYGEGNFPVACGMLRRYPELLQATQANWGSSRDNFDPVVACDDPKLQLPSSVARLDDDLAGPGGTGNVCGTIRFGLDRANASYLQLIQYAPEALLPPFTALGGNPNVNAPPVGQQEQVGMQRLGIGPDTVPLQAWGETDISSHIQESHVASDFKQAKADLATHYQSAFGLSPADAEQAAFRAAWLVERAWTWADAGKPDPLAEALLGHQSLTQVQAALAAESPVRASLLFDAVAYPEALKLLLAQHPDLSVTTPIGKTVLMEAAKYNQLESVQLLLAAGAAVNAASLPPGNIPNNGYNAGYGYPCGGIYEIYHGSRTALMYAAANSGLPVINALLAAGADTGAKDSTGATALDYLEGHGPASKNPVLDAADFKIAAQELSNLNPHVAKPSTPHTT